MKEAAHKLHTGSKPKKQGQGRDGSYDIGRAAGQRQSIYSPHCVIPITKGHGVCLGCGQEHDLINGYCDTCRVMGLNERQCLNTRAIYALREVADLQRQGDHHD